MSYLRFAAMIATSTVTMFVLMYLNTYAVEHVFWSETRAYMAVLMGAVMAFIMLAFMLSMYSSKAANTAIFAGSVIVFGATLWLVRSQETVQDRSFMEAMIPHHSIAIMTSTRAELTDARVEKMAEGIARAQNLEIAEMRFLIADIGRNGEVREIYQDPAPRPGTVEEALGNTLISTLDPAPVAAEAVAEAGAFDCGFRRVEKEAPILLTREDGAITQLNGIVLSLEPEGEGVYSTPGLEISVRDAPDADWRAAHELVFALDAGLTVGYRGFYDCGL